MAGFNINHTDTSGVEDKILEAHIQSVSEYRDKLSSILDDNAYNEPESALRLPTDDELMQDVASTAQQMSRQGSLEYVVVIGMGGSVRGTKAVYDLVAQETEAQMLFLNSVSSSDISNVIDKLRTCQNPDRFAVCVVSKSGTTTETISNSNILLQELSQDYARDAVLSRFVAITDADSQLDQLASEMSINRVHIPDQVGGRFSVLSAVGLLPLLLAELDVRELVGGAQSIRDAALSGRAELDPAAAMAGILYEHAESARRIINHFYFNPQAMYLGRWSEQLFAESLGKQRNRQGEPTYAGLYPTTTIGPDDLHSLLQLQLGGPKNFFSVFVRETDTDYQDLSRKINSHFLVEKLSYLHGKTLGQARSALSQSVIKSFADADRPFVEISVPRMNMKRIGQFMMLEQIVVMYLGELMNVNPFNQPQVEGYKDHTRQLLET